LISIIIPVYNCERYIAEAIESALNQTWEDKEIIVIDDGSTDGTAEIAKSYKVIYIYKPNGGTGSALNMGIKLARGDWIKWLSAFMMSFLWFTLGVSWNRFSIFPSLSIMS